MEQTYHLSDEQVAAFDRDGFLVLPQRIPPDLLDLMRTAAHGWVESAKRGLRDGLVDPDIHVADRDGRPTLFRVDYVHSKGDVASLVLLGSPEVLGIAESLAGPDFVPTYESLVLKDTGDGAPIAWHQDAVHPRAHRIFNVDVYLDDSHAGAGALRVVPGSQRGPQDICGLRDEHGWDVPDVVEVAVRAGDVLVHDVMVVHGSPATSGASLRRTLYYEFRSRRQILEEGPWDADWVDRRLRLLGPALDAHAAARPHVAAFAWNLDPALRPPRATDPAYDLRVAHEVHTPGSYCSAGDVPVVA